MKKKKIMIIGVIAALIIAIVGITAVSQSSKMSERSFDAVVQEIVTQPDGEVRLIVERTTEIYGDPVNSLGISEDTKLLDADGKEISVNDFKQGVFDHRISQAGGNIRHRGSFLLRLLHIRVHKHGTAGA